MNRIDSSIMQALSFEKPFESPQNISIYSQKDRITGWDQIYELNSPANKFFEVSTCDKIFTTCTPKTNNGSISKLSQKIKQHHKERTKSNSIKPKITEISIKTIRSSHKSAQSMAFHNKYSIYAHNRAKLFNFKFKNNKKLDLIEDSLKKTIKINSIFNDKLDEDDRGKFFIKRRKNFKENSSVIKMLLSNNQKTK